MAKKEIPLTNSPRVLADLKRIKAQKNRRLNKFGEWYESNDPNKFNIEVLDWRAVMR